MGVFGANMCKKWNIYVLFKKKIITQQKLQSSYKLNYTTKISIYVHFFLTGTGSVYFGWIRYMCKLSISLIKKGLLQFKV